MFDLGFGQEAVLVLIHLVETFSHSSGGFGFGNFSVFVCVGSSDELGGVGGVWPAISIAAAAPSARMGTPGVRVGLEGDLEDLRRRATPFLHVVTG